MILCQEKDTPDTQYSRIAVAMNLYDLAVEFYVLTGFSVGLHYSQLKS